MKQSIWFVLLIFLALALAACGAAQGDQAQAAAAEVEMEAKTAVPATEAPPTAVPATEAPPPTAGPAPAAAPAKEESADPFAVVAAYVEAANSGKVEDALAFFADDAVVSNPLGLFSGKKQISAWLAGDVKGTRAQPEAWLQDGPFVVNTGMVTLARLEQAGIGPVQYRSEYRLNESGQIVWFAPRVLLTPEQQETMRAAQIAPPLPADELIATARSYTEAVNAGDYDAALSYFADNAVVSNPLGQFVGREAIAAWLVEDVQTTRSQLSNWALRPPFVVAEGPVSLARFEAMGIGDVAAAVEFLVQDGKIVLFRPRVTLSPKQKAAVDAAVASAQAQAGPATGQDPFAGTWAGAMSFDDEADAEEIVVVIPAGCQKGRVCGSIENLSVSCTWELTLTERSADVFTYVFSDTLSGECPAPGVGTLTLKPDGTLFREHDTGDFVASGPLQRQP